MSGDDAMKRTQLNFIIDALAFVTFLALLSTGLILNYQLPPGSGGLHGAGAGPGAAQREVSVLWSWTRHEWGQIHYWIAWTLIIILAVHLVLHWNWITCVVRGKRSSEASGIRFGLGLASVVALVALAVTPLLVPTATTPRQELQQQRSEIQSDGTPGAVASGSVELRGSMTLEEAADALGLTPREIAERLHMPDDVSTTERIGPLLRRHGLRMSDLRQAMRLEPTHPTDERSSSHRFEEQDP